MEEYGSVNEMTTRDYVRILFRHKGAIFMTIVTMMVAVIAGVLLQTKVYMAQVTMLVSGQKQAQAAYYTDIGVSSLRTVQIMMTQSEIVTSDPVIERAVVALGLQHKPLDYEKRFCSELKKPLINMFIRGTEKKMEKLTEEQKNAFLFRIAMEELREHIKVEPVRDTELFVIKVLDYNPLGAAVTANIVSRSYVIFDLEQQLAEMQLKYGEKNQSVIQLKEAIEKMQKGLTGSALPPIEAIGPATVKIIEQAKVPIKPAGLPRPVIVILALFLSVFMGVTLAFIFEYTDQTFRSPRELESCLGIDYLGSLPGKAKKSDYHNLSEQLYLLIKDRGVNSILFASTMPHEGVTPLIANLGAYMAENLRKKVLLIDANLRNPILHKVLKMPETGDFIKVIEGETSLEKGVRNISQNLYALTSGLSALNPVTVLESHMMKDLIKQASAKYELVLIDCAPMARFRDAAMASAFADGVVVAVREGRTRRHSVKAALEPLKARKANILGAVLTCRRYVIPGFIYNRV